MLRQRFWRSLDHLTPSQRLSSNLWVMSYVPGVLLTTPGPKSAAQSHLQVSSVALDPAGFGGFHRVLFPKAFPNRRASLVSWACGVRTHGWEARDDGRWFREFEGPPITIGEVSAFVMGRLLRDGLSERADLTA
jgi:hypothetical protein